MGYRWIGLASVGLAVAVIAGCGTDRPQAMRAEVKGRSASAAERSTEGKAAANEMPANKAASGGGGGGGDFAGRGGAPAAIAPMAGALPDSGMTPPGMEAENVQHSTDVDRYSGSTTLRRARASAPTAPARARINPNLYLSNSYLGGQGERERIEKLISEGVMVDGKRVKLEAFTRNYGQAFPIPTKEALSVMADTERTKIVEQGGATYLQVGLQAMKGELPRRPALNIALVIDCSGSMGDEDKMGAARAAAIRLVDALRPEDTISVVKFEDEAQVLVPSTRARNKPSLRRTLAALEPGGGTNIYAGLEAGLKQTARHASSETVNRVILLSDGEVTSGVTDRSAFERLAAAYSDRDIQTTAVGLGLSYNEDLMLAVAREGKGNYHFIKNGADTKTVFDSELNELTHVVAKAVKLRVVLGPGVGFVRALGARQLDKQETARVKADEKKIDRRVAEELGIRQNRDPDRDEPGIKLLIPSFYRGDNHVVMLEITVPPGKKTCKIADVHLEYKDLVSHSNREVRSACTVSYTPHRDVMIASVDRSVKKNLLGFQTGEALIAAARLMEQGQVAGAIKKVDERMAVLGVAAREWSDRDLDRDGKLLNRYKLVLAQVSRNGLYAENEFGQYLRKSLSYAGYRMTR